MCYMGRVAEDLDNEEKAELLGMIVDIYVVVRGFSFSQSLLESYKQMHKKALQNPVVFGRLYMHVLVRKTNSVRLYRLCKFLMTLYYLA